MSKRIEYPVIRKEDIRLGDEIEFSEWEFEPNGGPLVEYLVTLNVTSEPYQTHTGTTVVSFERVSGVREDGTPYSGHLSKQGELGITALDAHQEIRLVSTQMASAPSQQPGFVEAEVQTELAVPAMYATPGMHVRFPNRGEIIEGVVSVVEPFMDAGGSLCLYVTTESYSGGPTFSTTKYWVSPGLELTYQAQ